MAGYRRQQGPGEGEPSMRSVTRRTIGDRQCNEGDQRPLIERTYRVRLPGGEEAEVNRFDLNMSRFADSDGGYDRYIQMSDGAWIRHRLLTVLGT
ncbi:hypothetical protein LCGC14_2336120 [marine sediment metagenome]|uniref:Uncharacterized protein n=1 Tax=marine sediment metagenome TaxID=412755 RepID=A0A0F9F8G2_9ZZZZ